MTQHQIAAGVGPWMRPAPSAIAIRPVLHEGRNFVVPPYLGSFSGEVSLKGPGRMTMKIHAGYEISYDCLQPTPMILTLSVHPTRRARLCSRRIGCCSIPLVPTKEYCDGYGNICHVIRAPAGRLTISADFLVRDSGEPDEVAPEPRSARLKRCQSRRWSIFSAAATAKPTACRISPGRPSGRFRKAGRWCRPSSTSCIITSRFGYPHANSTRTAFDTFTEGRGVCRDFAHLAVTLCRCMNIPARYCTGYLGDIGVPPDPAPMDFSAWFEAYLGDRWYTFDARHNKPRIGRILIARGRDATDVAITTSYGPAHSWASRWSPTR